MYNYNYNYTYDTSSLSSGAEAWVGIAAILAIVGGILTYFLFVKSKNEPKNNFAKWLKKFLDFKIIWIEGILKVIYYVATIFIILFSFAFLGNGANGVLAFFLTLILGPIFIRLIYEATMMLVMIWRNTKDIADNTAKNK
jgi:cellulose synthase/poly-beta-1,6-N-acetylglucosamine synthase-like glycosyltransferase